MNEVNQFRHSSTYSTHFLPETKYAKETVQIAGNTARIYGFVDDDYNSNDTLLNLVEKKNPHVRRESKTYRQLFLAAWPPLTWNISEKVKLSTCLSQDLKKCLLSKPLPRSTFPSFSKMKWTRQAGTFTKWMRKQTTTQYTRPTVSTSES